MGNKLLSLHKIRQILLFLDRGVSRRRIEKEVQITRKTIALYLQKFQQTGQSLTQLIQLSNDELKQVLDLIKPTIPEDTDPRKIHFNSSLKKTLETMPRYRPHYDWLINELKRRNKEFDEGGLLFVLNRFRDELSHAGDTRRNRNIFNDLTFFSLAFIAMNVCLFVSIKKRLLPFVHKNQKENFLGS